MGVVIVTTAHAQKHDVCTLLYTYANNMDCTTCTVCIAFYTQNKLTIIIKPSLVTLQMLMNIQSVCACLQCRWYYPYDMFLNAGRLFVERCIHDEFVARMVRISANSEE